MPPRQASGLEHSLTHFEQLKSSSVRQCKAANDQLVQKLNLTTRENNRLKEKLSALSVADNSGGGSQQPAASSVGPTASSSQFGWSGAGSMVAACGEMQQLALLLMDKVDTMQLPVPPKRPAHLQSLETTPTSPAAMQITKRPAMAVGSLEGGQPSGLSAITSPAAIASSAARAISIVDAASLVTSLDRDDISSLPSIEYRALQELHGHLAMLFDKGGDGKAKCWICDETDKPAQLTVRCGCVDRMAHQLCLTEWIDMLDGNPLATRCAACNHQFQVN